MGRYLYYTNLLVYVVYLIFFTGFALTIPSPIRVVTEDFDPKYSAKTVANASVKDQVAFLADNNMTLPTDMPSLIQRRVFVDFGLYIAIIIIALKIASELFQLSNSPFSYFQNLENLLEWFLYVTSLLFCFLSLLILIIVSIFCVPWQWQTGAVAVFLAWMELILIIRKLPWLGIYVVMFTHIIATFARFFIVFFLFIIGFAVSFHMLLVNQAPFKEVENSLLKTAIMMIGEFEFDSIFNESGVKVFYPHAAYIIFICFVIVMSIIIMNLLVGLAVDDIKGVQEQAVLTRKGMQVELALAVEAKLPEFITRKNIQTEWKVKPNASADICSGLTGAIFSRKNFKVLVEALNPELDDIEKVMEKNKNVLKLNSVK
ncbi:hypothetical protein EB796_005782 [Bugula neritina]|uniref:Ion transport domain-containing protein n=1 Tax=Bugula neritina TaxID=10212 RepID=A0A7J7KED9_BUGNE|nr:hypothetical protein EB796_005782 [Bugula neritina]